MRGLTPLERYALERRVSCAPLVFFDPGTPEHTAVGELWASGRLRLSLDSADGQVSSITDLGRLALRVCPVGEP